MLRSSRATSLPRLAYAVHQHMLQRSRLAPRLPCPSAPPRLPPQPHPPTTRAAHSSSATATTTTTTTQASAQAAVAPERPPNLPAAAPTARPCTNEQLERLASFLTSCRHVVALTGAGVSTESNIPDYRGPTGAYTTGFKPMTHQQFLASEQSRARYWARSFVGWHEFADVQPSDAHAGLARLQRGGWVGPIITQNVDRLHQKAGAQRVEELHGTTHRVVCLSCGANTCRHELQRQLQRLNPAAAELAAEIMRRTQDPRSRKAAWDRALRVGTAADATKVNEPGAMEVPVRRPDGDVELQDAGQGFQVPPCASCGGVLKPDVVFFGDSVPKPKVERLFSMVGDADGLLVVGSSLMVWSAFRFVKSAKERGARLALVNVGPTRADDLADLKVEALAGEVMMRLAAHPSLMLPRV